ncbi:MAG TPA: hypothetical protein PLZ00_08720, partial [Mangrovimonas sp.]|nr:hypothetical protein [Mangrovimonas sp.]
LEAKIHSLEKEIKEIDVDLATNYDEVVSNPTFFDTYQKKKSNLEKLMEEWEMVQEEIDNLV